LLADTDHPDEPHVPALAHLLALGGTTLDLPRARARREKKQRQ
jgi:hypothetical protein